MKKSTKKLEQLPFDIFNINKSILFTANDSKYGGLDYRRINLIPSITTHEKLLLSYTPLYHILEDSYLTSSMGKYFVYLKDLQTFTTLINGKFGLASNRELLLKLYEDNQYLIILYFLQFDPRSFRTYYDILENILTVCNAPSLPFRVIPWIPSYIGVIASSARRLMDVAIYNVGTVTPISLKDKEDGISSYLVSKYFIIELVPINDTAAVNTEKGRSSSSSCELSYRMKVIMSLMVAKGYESQVLVNATIGSPVDTELLQLWVDKSLHEGSHRLSEAYNRMVLSPLTKGGIKTVVFDDLHNAMYNGYKTPNFDDFEEEEQYAKSKLETVMLQEAESLAQSS